MELETERIILRRWKNEDFEVFSALNADKNVMEFFPSTLTPEETSAMIDRIEAHFQKHGFGLWAMELKSTGEFIGFNGLSVPNFESYFTPCVEIGWRMSDKFWGKGLASEAAREVLKYGFSQLNLEEIVSFTATVNIRSISVMKRIGMSFSGEFNHPKLAPESNLCRHVLYKISKKDFLKT